MCIRDRLGRHRKPIVIANIGDFWRPLASLLDHMTVEGFIHTAHQVRPLVIDRVEDILPSIEAAAATTSDTGREEIIERL